jgi:hypothetical protein
MLAAVPFLNPSKNCGRNMLQHTVSLREMRDKPRILWWDLPAGLQSEAGRLIANLALFVMRADTILREAQGGHALQQYLFIDEFAVLAGPAFETIVQQARSMKIALVLANQSLWDLHKAQYDLIPTLEECTRCRRFFSAIGRRQRDDLMEASGDTIDYLLSSTEGDNGLRRSEMETVCFRIPRNDIIRISDDAFLSIVLLPRGDGYARFAGFPFVVFGQHHIPSKLFRERDSRPWPQPSDEYPGAFIPSQFAPQFAFAEDASSKAEAMIRDEETQAAMRRLIAQQQAKRDEQRARRKQERGKSRGDRQN